MEAAPFILLFILLIGYLFGSIPFGLLLTKMAGYGDIRKIGSGNIGATNVLRTGSKKLAALTVLLDAGKGAAAVWLFAGLAAGDPLNLASLIAGIGAVFGHMFPIWLKFKGGKGVATSFGIIAAFSWPAGLAALGIWIIVAALFRTSSLSALITAILIPFVSLWPLSLATTNYNLTDVLKNFTYLTDKNSFVDSVLTVFLISFLVIAKHHANIRRLLNGTEPKMSFGSKK